MIVFFEPRCASFFGAQKSMAVLAVGMARRGHDVKVVTTGEGVLCESVRKMGLDCEILPLGANANQFGGAIGKSSLYRKVLLAGELLGYFFRAIMWMRRERPQVMYFNNDRAVMLMGGAALLNGIPSIFYVRGAWRNTLTAPFCAAIPSKILLIAEGVRGYFSQCELKLFGKKMKVLYTGFEVEAFAGEMERVHWRISQGWRAETKIVCVVGSLSPRKNQRQVLEVFAGMRALVPSVKLLVAGSAAHGEEDYGAGLKLQAENLGIASDVVWMGYVKDLAPIYAGSDLCLLASEAEGLPRVVLEALGCGCAVVATDVGGAREALRERHLGYVVPAGNADAMQEVAVEVLRNFPQTDEARWKRRRFVEENFSMGKYIVGFEAVVGELTRRSRFGPRA